MQLQADEATYIPACSPIQLAVLLGKNLEKGLKLSWYHEKGLVQHPYILTSAFYGIDKAWKDCFNEWFHIDKEKVIHFGDSGGFQAATQKYQMDVADVVRWGEANCQVLFALDDPGEYVIVGDEGKKDRVSSSEFEISARKTLQNNEQYLKLRTNKDLKFYNVLHGGSLDQIEMWYNYVSQTPMEGWALGMKPVSDPVPFTFAAMYMWNKGLRENVHFFGVSGFTVIPIIIYMSKFFKNVTFDSTSYAIGSMYRRYFNPLDYQTKIVIGDKSVQKFKVLPCDCPVCNSITKMEKLYEPGAFSGSLISMHNLWCIVRWVKLQNRLRRSEEDYKEYHRGNLRVVQMIQFIDDCMAMGFEKACQKWWWLLHDSYHLFDSESARWSFLDSKLFEAQTVMPPKDMKVELPSPKEVSEEAGVVLPYWACDWL